MTTLTAPLATITLQALLPDVVRSCVVQQPAPPPNPGETPPPPIDGPGIYTPVPPGITLPSLPPVTIIDTSPDQMIGCIISTGTNPQGRLNALFPAAIDGDGVIERNTNDIWVYDGALWENVGPNPGPTIVNPPIIPPWNEIVITDAITRTKLNITSLDYALTILTEPDPVITQTALLARNVTAYVAVPSTDFTFTVHTPTVVSGVAVSVPAFNAVLSTAEPTVMQANVIHVPPVGIETATFNPDYVGRPATFIPTPTSDTTTTSHTPAISSGASISANVFNVSLSGLVATIYDPDAAKYIRLVEAEDAQSLEHGVREAINTFVVGCKSDGIWSAIKASCILAGARTLDGALIPLVGTAPTNVNFVSGDYNRETGLKGNASTKYLDANRSDNSDPQNSYHASVYVTTAASAGDQHYIGAVGTGGSVYSVIQRRTAGTLLAVSRSALADLFTFGSSSTTGFIGTTRSGSTAYSYRAAGTTATKTSATSAAPVGINTYVFARNLQGTGANAYGDGRISFYSVGESVNLALLDARVTQLMADIAAAIP
jgi:hypothetical protein